MPENISENVNKYESKDEKPLVVRVPFAVIKTVDKLNDFAPAEESGVGVFVAATK